MHFHSANDALSHFTKEIEDPWTTDQRFNGILNYLQTKFPEIEFTESAIGIIIDEIGRKLLLKRTATDRSYPEMWCFPGGSRENVANSQEKELLSETVVRETHEETQLSTRVIQEIAVRRTVNLLRSRIYELHCYLLEPELPNLTPQLSEEHTAWQFFASNEIPDNIGKVTREMFQWSR